MWKFIDGSVVVCFFWTLVANIELVQTNLSQPPAQPCDRTRRVFTEAYGEISDGPAVNYTQNMDDIKVYDQKLKDLQSHIPFLSDFITKVKARGQTEQTQFLSNLEKLYQHANTKKKLKLELIIKIEKAIKQLKDKYESKKKTNTEIIDSATIKKEDLYDKASTSESISETPDSPPPTRHYDRTSPIEIPTERHPDSSSSTITTILKSRTEPTEVHENP